MIIIREVIATVFLCLGLAFLILAFSANNPLVTVAYSALCLLAAYIIWPHSRSHSKDRDNYWIETLIELAIEFPVELIKFVFRALGRLVGKSDGFDVDL